MNKTCLVAVFAVALCACAGGPGSRPVIDATSEAQFEASLEQMYATLDHGQRVQLMLSLYRLGVDHLRATGQVDARGEPVGPVRAYVVADRVGGKSYGEIVGMAARGA